MKQSILILIVGILLINGCSNSSRNSDKKNEPMLEANSQEHSNKLFSAATFLTFTESVEKGEEKLLKMDFSFVQKHVSENTYYNFRLDHSANHKTGKYSFDLYSISNDVTKFTYRTSKQKNYLSYRNKMIDFGFIKVKDDQYQYNKLGREYFMSIERETNDNLSFYAITIRY